MPGEPVPAGELPDVDEGVVMVEIERLRSADSPRLNGVDEAHAKLLAESAGNLPPILVQRGSMRVVDGMHRLRVAQIQRQTHIAVRYLDDDDDDAFLRSVAENIEHGLPLTLADRKAAAARIIDAHPDWSDRTVGRAAGISGKTVGVIRSTRSNVPHLNRRKGRDGKMRPVDGTAGRQRAGELLADRPDASLREIAAAAGVSPATVCSVRDRMARGEQPARSGPQISHVTTSSRRSHGPLAAVTDIDADTDSAAILNELRRDPALRYTEVGRTLLRWLYTGSFVSRLEDLAPGLPTHCLLLVARLSRDYANRWTSFADLMEKRARSGTA